MSTPEPVEGALDREPDRVPLSFLQAHSDSRILYRELRHDHGPVVPLELPGGIPAWLVIGYREMHQVTTDPVLYSRDVALWNQWGKISPDWPLLPSFAEPEPRVYYTSATRHRKYSGMIEGALETVDPFELRRTCEVWSDRLIDGFCGRGDAELVSEFADSLPILTMARAMGFNDDEAPRLTWLMKTMIGAGPEALQAIENIAETMLRLVASRRGRPSSDLASMMLRHSAQFSDMEYVRSMLSVIVSGNLSTTNWLVNSLGLMLTDEQFASAFGGGRRSVAQAMNEVLWEDSPTQTAMRWAEQDTRLGDTTIRGGDLLLLSLAAANADPLVRADWVTDDFGHADNNAHFAFGYGEYRCPFPAQQMAEIIARTGIEVLLDRLPDLDLADPDEGLAWQLSAFQRQMTALRVRFTPVHAVGGLP